MLSQNFNAENLAGELSKHSEDLIQINERLEEIEKRISTPEGVCKMISDVTTDSKQFDNIISKLFCNLLRKDENIGECMNKFVSESDRGAVIKLVKMFGKMTAWIISLVITAVITAMITSWITQG